MRRIVFLVAFPAIAIVLTAGGCSSKSSNTTAATSTTAAPSSTSHTASAQETQFCNEVTANLPVLQSADQSTFPQFVVALAKLEAVAPEVVKADLAKAHDAYAAAESGDASQVDAATQSLTKIATYVSSTCGIQLSG